MENYFIEISNGLTSNAPTITTLVLILESIPIFSDDPDKLIHVTTYFFLSISAIKAVVNTLCNVFLIEHVNLSCYHGSQSP